MKRSGASCCMAHSPSADFQHFLKSGLIAKLSWCLKTAQKYSELQGELGLQRVSCGGVWPQIGSDKAAPESSGGAAAHPHIDPLAGVNLPQHLDSQGR